MDVKADSLYQEMQSMIGQTRLQPMEPQQLSEVNTSASEFSTMLKNAVDGVNSLQLESRSQQQRFEMGDKSLSLADVMVAKENLALHLKQHYKCETKCLKHTSKL